MDSIIFSPHDDDALIGCSSVLNGSAVVIVTDGSLGYSSTEEKDRIKAIRMEEAKKAYSNYETKIIRLEFKDMSLKPYECFTTIDGRRGLYSHFIQLIREIRPRIVFIPNKLDEHPDHRSVYNASLVAIKQASSPILPDLGSPHRIDTVLQYEVWNQVEKRHLSKEVNLKKKLNALSLFKSQNRIFDELPELSENEYFQTNINHLYT